MSGQAQTVSNSDESGHGLSGLDAAGNSMRRILLVDSQAHVLRVMKLCLERNGYDVDTALNAEVALKMMLEASYDVVITDFDLNNMDGRQLCLTVEAQYGALGPLMFLVAEADDHAAHEWVEGVNKTECLDKPVSLRWMVARLNEHFGHYETAVDA